MARSSGQELKVTMSSSGIFLLAPEEGDEYKDMWINFEMSEGPVRIYRFGNKYQYTYLIQRQSQWTRFKRVCGELGSMEWTSLGLMASAILLAIWLAVDVLFLRL
jgi:hypothetical protein